MKIFKPIETKNLHKTLEKGKTYFKTLEKAKTYNEYLNKEYMDVTEEGKEGEDDKSESLLIKTLDQWKEIAKVFKGEDAPEIDISELDIFKIDTPNTPEVPEELFEPTNEDDKQTKHDLEKKEFELKAKEKYLKKEQAKFKEEVEKLKAEKAKIEQDRAEIEKDKEEISKLLKQIEVDELEKPRNKDLIDLLS